MSDTDDLVDLLKGRLVAMARLNRDLVEVQISEHASFMTNDVVVRTMIDALFQEYDVFDYPATWCDALRATRPFGWLRRFWPVRYRRRSVRVFCPHLLDAKREEHLGFLTASPEVTESIC